MSTTSDLIAYYQQLLIIQYANKTKMAGTVAAMLSGTGATGLLANAIYTQVRDGFDLETAVGKQLDILGELIGPSRNIPGLDLSKSFIQITAYGAVDMGTVVGISTYEETQPPSWYTMSYEDFVVDTLSDGDYRRVLQFLAAVQGCDYAYGTLDAICYNFFTGNVNLKVTGTMTLVYQHLTSDPDNLFEIISQMNMLPSPAGVSVTVAEVASFT